MTNLQYIITHTESIPEETCMGCVTQQEFEVFLKECYPECKPNGTVKFPEFIERCYHIIKDDKEIAKVKAVYRPNETEVSVDGRKCADVSEVLNTLKTKNGFRWEEKNNHHNHHPNNYQKSRNLNDITDYIRSM